MLPRLGPGGGSGRFNGNSRPGTQVATAEGWALQVAHRKRSLDRLVAMALLASCWVAPLGRGQEAPLVIGAATPILNGNGAPLHGMDPSASTLFGLSGPPGCLVQVLKGPTIYPPNADGTPHASNTLLMTTRIGRGVIPTPSEAGKFGASVSPRPSGTVFVRAFDGASLAQSTRFGNSQIFTVNGNSVFLAAIASTDQAFATDTDGDGLNDAWEEYLDSEEDDADTDGDGVSDGDEYRAGTDLDGHDSFLGIEYMGKGLGGGVVGWQAVSGKAYQVQFCGGDLATGPTFTDIGSPVVATGDYVAVTVPTDSITGRGQLRVRLVE